MPHDVNGIELAVGDRVTLTGTVKAVYPGAENCNCEIVVDNGPGESYAPFLTMNAKGVIKQIRHEPTAD